MTHHTTPDIAGHVNHMMRGEHEQQAAKALEYLKLAMTAANAAGSVRTAERIKHAISSAKGAVRAAGYRDARKAGR